MLHFQPFDGTLDDWGGILSGYPDRQIYQTPAWMRFVAASQSAEPVVAVLCDGNLCVGHFAGLVIRRAALRILGSPFPGWTTSYMGMRLGQDVHKRDALQALTRFAFRRLACVHLEVMDRQFSPDDAAGLGFEHRDNQTLEIDLTQSEDEIFARMTSACRRCVRKSQRERLVVEEARDAAFVDDYYAQLQEVFARQSLVPTYPKERVRLLVRHVLPSGMLLLLRARDPAGRCIATGIFPAYNDHMHFFGGASWRDAQGLRPNEALHWHAMRYWKGRGVAAYDMCGTTEYKKKFGGVEVSMPWFRKSRHRWIAGLRSLAHDVFRFKQRVLGKWAAGKQDRGTTPDE